VFPRDIREWSESKLNALYTEHRNTFDKAFKGRPHVMGFLLVFEAAYYSKALHAVGYLR
jgi:hypothetical protein